ncbi:MAG: Gfo/Idh/MocA family oxidoreductase [Steroidobacteraceae bacterium]
MIQNPETTSVAVIGCGFVADLYMATLPGLTGVRIAGVFDIDAARLQVFTSHYGLTAYSSLDQLLADEQVTLVINLTNPRAHFEVSRQCLAAGKHVYSEKPLAMELRDAQALVDLAAQRDLQISSAPCSLMSDAAQTLWHAVRTRPLGDIRLVYAELDDGMVHRMQYRKWVSATGAPWPYKDEFEVGCTLEHAGYYLGWLIAMFGAVTTVTAFADCLYPEKLRGETLIPPDAPDMSIGVLKFESGVVARLSTTIVAPHDHRIRLFGEGGVIEMDDCWFNDAPVYLRHSHTIRRKTFLSPLRRRYRAPRRPQRGAATFGAARMDFCLGIGDMLAAIRDNRDPYLSGQFSLHVNEVALALSNASRHPGIYRTTTRFVPPRPLLP